ncbi:protein NLP7-like isoform X2 [Abrus precatorius]|uniref:Protein NLP7-like isoform X2 n=1 Tax=Abrus precatorius TaxID=3816 RepID=A0A8B8LQN8_ABRPR|nr:protein NLP7-like isoform X2 [Abrus precatorius]
MSESKEENCDLPHKSKTQEEHGFAMDFDIDLESSWPLDHISLVSNPMSPFFLSTISEQPFSPVWAFSDVEEDRYVKISGNTNTVTENPAENADTKKTVSSLAEMPPLENPDGYCLIKERMTQALRHFKELTEQNVLVQVWAPVRNGNRYALTTSGQPFVLDPYSNGLNQYRTVSLMYMFSVDGENDEILGLPGRVFQQKIPEWTPNVQYYSSKEYQRLNHAQHYNVRGTLALPVFEPPGQSCVAVLELIMTSPKINYAPEVDKICKALEAVNLRSSEILEHPYNKICNEDRQMALAEILEILTIVCETHNLPLAQTWVPCRHRSVLAHGGGLKKNCSSFDGCCMGQVCMSITEAAFYVIDAHTWGFHEACVEHHLQQGQGVAGRAFLSQNMSFCGNITQFCKTEYPLVHYALMFGLTSCFAICLQNSHTGNDDYVLEFFLPSRITDFNEQKNLLGSILATMKPHFQSLKIAAGVELEEEGSIEIIEAINKRVFLRLESIPITHSSKSPPRLDVSPNMREMVPLHPSEQQIGTFLDDINDGGSFGDSTGGCIKQNASLGSNTTKKPSERKRGKAEKSISLDVLQHYFSGSLKDAAKSLGVCPTTMKRICRQHGISRWPSRKIKKVNRSLSKLKCVIESVHGAEGAFDLNSLSTSSFPIASVSFTEPSTSNKFNYQASLSIRPSEAKMNENDLDASKVSETNKQAGTEDQLVGARTQSFEKVINDKGGSTQEVGTKGTNEFGVRSGSSESSANPTSHGSCHGSPPNETSPAKDTFTTGNSEQYLVLRGSLESTLYSTSTQNFATAYPMPNVVETELQEPFGGKLLEGAGSSKDLRNLCPSADAILEDQVPEACRINPQCSDLAPIQHMDNLNDPMTHFAARKEMKSVTIKATYKEDIIRFKVSLNCGIEELKAEIAKRLKLEMGTFDIKYLDDDHEWVLIACDADLQECMDISGSSGSNIIRLVVHDILSILGSSCESSGD